MRKHLRRNTLTNYLGGHGGKVKADVRGCSSRTGDRVILCSDGLSDMVEDHGIAGCLVENPEPGVAAIALTQLALHNGGKDNITVVVAQYTIPGPGEAQPPLKTQPTTMNQRRSTPPRNTPSPPRAFLR